MGHNDRYDSEDRDKEEYLGSLLERLDSKAQGITKLVIDKGEDALSPKQKYVFQREVVDQYIITECKLCKDSVAWCEMAFTIESGGYCPHCDHLMNKDD
ncbi:MAG: hypothetical protein B6241_12350 [Spirochaetaceae bacterium 4572_59]|nr:MAG: hypothetical protein B6241_12350 [Spirochaetaceae bacterium 4572_59]